jgi:nitric oxide reductase NorQ protein
MCSATNPFYLPVAARSRDICSGTRSTVADLAEGRDGLRQDAALEYMSHRLGPLPLITVGCHEDLTATDLVGRYLLEGDRHSSS